MTFLPVVERELRVASRRRATYWTRFAGALVAIGLYVWIWIVVGDTGTGSSLPIALFYSLSIVGFLYSLLAGVNVTSDSLSEEKREGTLGLLFLTDLKGYDVVLGKLVATSVNSFYRLLAIFPVLAIPLLLGGLTYGEFWRMVLVLTNTLFFSLCVGIFLSAVSVHERKAMLGTFGLILLITAGPPLLGYIVAIRQVPHYYNPAFLLASSGYSYAMVLDVNFKVYGDGFWISVLLTHIFGWTFLVLASICVRYSWQDKPIDASAVQWREKWQRWQFGDSLARKRFRTRLLEINPFFWIAGRNRLKPGYVLGVLGFAGCLWLWLYVKYPDEILDSVTFIPTAIILHTLIKLWLASEACKPLSEERRTGSIELLLSTPLSIDEILRGQFLALNRQFGWPVAIVLSVDFVMFLAGIRDRFLDTTNDWLMLCLAGVLMFVADLVTLAWVAMWLGLTSRRSNRAAGGAVVRILILPWILFFGFITATVVVNVGSYNEPENLAVGAWFVIGMLNNLFFFTWARTNLRQQLRTVATQRFQSAAARRGWFGVGRKPVTANDSNAV